MNRYTLQPFTFSNGVTVPAGNFIACAALQTHMDEEYYEDAEVFNPWRFSDMRENAGESVKHHMVATGPENINFGHGRHAWYAITELLTLGCDLKNLASPGRFFAANELKCMLAHIVVNYDVKFRDGRAPGPIYFGSANIPAPAKVMFRKRQV